MHPFAALMDACPPDPPDQPKDALHHFLFEDVPPDEPNREPPPDELGKPGDTAQGQRCWRKTDRGWEPDDIRTAWVNAVAAYAKALR